MSINLPPFHATHRHYKGGLYEMLHLATHSETEEMLVVYRGTGGIVWVRPLGMFNERLPDGRLRFDPIA
jgi:hypothetical protein